MQDFVLELATWFRRAIWFIIVTAAILASPGLFITAAILGVIFETVYNVTNARRYWQEVYGQQGYDRGNLDYASGSSSKVGEDEYEYEDYVQYYPVATKQGGLYRGQLVSYGGVSRPSLAWDRLRYPPPFDRKAAPPKLTRPSSLQALSIGSCPRLDFRALCYSGTKKKEDL